MSKKWKHNDVFWWNYRERPKDPTQSYWCCARIAIVRQSNGPYAKEAPELFDIYWAHVIGYDVALLSDVKRRWNSAKAAKELELEYKGNLADFNPVRPYEIWPYASSDVLDLRHSNATGNQVYVRKGAAKSKDVMLAEVARRVEDRESDKRRAESALEDLAKAKAKIEDGDLDGVYL